MTSTCETSVSCVFIGFYCLFVIIYAMERTVGELNEGQRKKKSKWQAIRKEKRAEKYKCGDLLALNFERPCRHKETSKFKCGKLTIQDVIKVRELLNNCKGKEKQDQFLSRYLAPYQPQKQRPSNSRNNKNRHFSCSYYLLHKKKNVQVCKTFFQAAVSIKSRRLNTLGKILYAGAIPQEKRGGDRKSTKYEDKKEKVMSFLQSLPATETHYNRRKSKRCYLSSELTISKLWKLYNISVNESLKVKRTFFWKLFNTLNIGISSPASDVCSKCFFLTQKISMEQNAVLKQQYITEKRIHSLKAKAFYDLLKENEPENLTLCFDLQQVQPLPKTPIGESFYLRQISLYTMCVTTYGTKDPTFFSWTEDQAGKGSVCIGSALLNYLESSCNYFENVKTLRLFCDGCGGQNKNQHLVHALMFWLLYKAPTSLTKIKLYFPVRGHSFLPCDRVFARVEKDLRKCPFIPNREKYHEIYKRHGNLKLLGDDWCLFDIKSMSEYLRPMTGIQNLKRIYFKRSQNNRQCLIKIFENLRFEGNEKYKSYLKRGKSFPSQITMIQIGNKISEEKKRDVRALLIKQFGEDWQLMEELKYFREVLEGEWNTPGIEQFADDENDCECNEEEPNCVRI